MTKLAYQTNNEQSLDQKSAALDNLKDLVKNDLSKCNEIIIDRMQSPVSLIPELSKHLISSGGKRIRPMLTIASSQLFGYEGERHLKLAACVEFIHTATLLHDDVIDESKYRRGTPTANEVWGNQASVLVGDFLFSRSFQLMVEDGSLDVLNLLSSTSSIIAEGEVHQLLTTNNVSTTVDEYLDVIKAKTAQLFLAATRVGALVANASDNETNCISEFGLHLGFAFQLIDDYLDYKGENSTLGKSVGDDFSEGKMTLPVILAYQQGNDIEKQFWKRTIEELDQKENDFEKALSLINKYKTLDETLNFAKNYSEKAKSMLNQLPQNAMNKALIDVVDFCIQRAY